MYLYLIIFWGTLRPKFGVKTYQHLQKANPHCPKLTQNGHTKKKLTEFYKTGIDLPILQFNPIDNVQKSFDLLTKTFSVLDYNKGRLFWCHTLALSDSWTHGLRLEILLSDFCLTFV